MPTGVYRHKPHSAATKEKLSMVARGRPKSVETVSRRLETIKQRYPGGLKKSEIAKQKTSMSLKDVYANGTRIPVAYLLSKEETKAKTGKRSKTMKKRYPEGFKHSVEARERMSVSAINRVVSDCGPCQNTRPEQLMRSILNELGIEFKFQYPLRTSKITCKVDFYIPSLNLIIEVDGVYWHAHPDLYEADQYMYTDAKTKQGLTARDVWHRDQIRTRNLEEAGYRVLRFWEGRFSKGVVDQALEVANV